MKYESDERYQMRLNSFQNLFTSPSLSSLSSSLSSLSSHLNHLFVIKYRKDCGHICHEFIVKLLNEKQVNEYHYEILNSEHGVIRVSSHVMKSLHSDYSTYITDYIPFLPELKIEENVYNENNCEHQINNNDNNNNENSSDNENNQEITLHIVFTHFLSDSNISTLIKYGQLQDTTDLPNTLELSSNSYQISHCIILSCSLLSTISFDTILEYYSHLPSVHWIEVRPSLSIYTRFANSLTQLDSDKSHSGSNVYQYYKAMNLTGMGQIIGISDTGIDVQSCYFYYLRILMK